MNEEEKKKLLKEVSSIVEYDKPKEKKAIIKKDTWWSKIFNKDKLKKSNKVAVIYLRNNGNVDLLQEESRNGFFNVGNKSYQEDIDCTYTLTKDRIPLVIIKEWDIIPVGTRKWEEQSMRNMFSKLQHHVLSGIRHAELVRSGAGGLDSKTISTKSAIIWGIVALVLGAVLINYI